MKRILDRKRNEPSEREIQKNPREGGKEAEKCPICGCDLVTGEGKKICTHRNCIYTETD